MPKQLTMAEALGSILESFRSDLHVALPGIVRSYDSSTQTADIEPAVQRVIPSGDPEDEEDTPERLPVIPSVPIAWPRAGAFFLHFPLAAGDTVLLVFSESDLNEWRAGSGEVVDPALAGRHGLSGAVAIPGLSTRGNLIEDAGSNPRIGNDGDVYLEFPGDGTVQVGPSAADAAALASAVDALQSNLNDLITLFNAHTHSVTTAPGTTGGPSGAASSSAETFASDILKIDS